MVKDLAKQDAVFVGEMHNCPICHWLEKRLLQSLHEACAANTKDKKGKNAKTGKTLAVGMEMFEADNQLIIDEFFAQQITVDRFDDEVRFWPNYSTDYEALVDYAYEHRLPLVATNVPRRYANAVKNHGLAFLDSLSDDAKRYLPPLPIPYQVNEQANEAFGMMAAMGKGKGSNPEWLSQSQALKDATMAWNSAQWLKQGYKLVHFNGNYHTSGNEGILTYLRHYAPKARYKTIYSVRQDDVTTLEEDYLGQADYYIAVTGDMVTSY
jgi:uncharacterized iron-regulated protein